jgi:hypothetical protein
MREPVWGETALRCMIPFPYLAPQVRALFDACSYRPPVPIIPGFDDPAVAGLCYCRALR